MFMFIKRALTGFNGTRRSYEAFGRVTPLKSPFSLIGLAHLETGDPSSDRVGSMLIGLAVETGEWQAVPWQMLRNACLQNGLLTRFRGRDRTRLVSLPNGEPIAGADGDPIPDWLLTGLDRLMRNGFVKIDRRGDDYLMVTDELIEAVASVERPRRHMNENFAFRQ